jgi:hypothetical protein
MNEQINSGPSWWTQFTDFISPKSPEPFAGVGGAGGDGGILPSERSGGGILGSNQGPATRLGLNVGTGQLALSGLGALSNLWSGMQAMNLAKSQLAFQKGFANANLSNQIQSYNTTLADRARARAVTEGQSQAQADQYVAQNRLAPRTI